MRPTTRLRQMLASGRLVLAPFVYDAFQARLAERVGFSCVYMTGFGTAAAHGYPDLGLLTQTEMVQNARRIARAVSVPVIADADTGYGNPLNVWRTVREYEDAGVAGIHIEDQVFPKRCGFLEGKQVIPLEEFLPKLRSALDARRDPDFVIIARTDALAVHGWEETVRRARAFHEAGADLVFVDGIKTVEDLHIYARELADLPRLYNGMLLPAPEVERLGFKVMIAPLTLRVVYQALKEAFQTLLQTGTAPGARDLPVEDLAEVVGLSFWRDLEQRYVARQPSGVEGQR